MQGLVLPTNPGAYPTAGVNAFANLTEKDRHRLATVTTIETAQAGETLFYEGDPANHLIEVIEGVVKLYKLLPDGRCQITGWMVAGQFGGLTPVGTYGQSAEAVTNVRVCRYNRAQLDRLVDDMPGLGRRLLDITCRDLASAQNQILWLGRKTAMERVASFLLHLSDQAERRDEDEAALYLPMRRCDIADYLGLTLETVSRMFSRLQAMGVIKISAQGRDVRVDVERLADLAEGDEEIRLH